MAQELARQKDLLLLYHLYSKASNEMRESVQCKKLLLLVMYDVVE